MPVVSAIGHEIDVTLADLAADVRALTPSEAAERVSPSQQDLEAELEGIERLLQRLWERKLHLARSYVDALAARPVLARPEQPLRDLARRVDEWDMRLTQALGQQLKLARQQLRNFAGRLDALSPLAVLSRGYSLTQRKRDGELIRDARQIAVGEQIRTRLAQGQLISRVELVINEDSESESG